MPANLIRIAVSIGVSLLTLALLFRLVLSGQDPAHLPHLIDLLRNTLPGGVLLYLVLHLLGLVVRARRYQLLISGAGDAAPGFGHMTLVTGFRGMMVDMLPARTGELAYVAMLNRGYRVGIAACLSSLGLAVVFDFLALAVVVVLAILVFAVTGEVEPWLWSALLVAILLAGVAVFGVISVLPWLSRRMADSGQQHWLGRLVERLGQWLQQLDQAVTKTRDAGILVRILSLSVLIRCLKYLSLLALFIAVAEPSFPVLAEASRAKIFAAIVGAELGAALPIPTFMSFGSYEAGGTLAFALVGISGADALMSLLSIHIWSQAVDYALGGLCLVLVILLARRNTTEQRPVRRIGRLAAAAVAGMVLLSGLAALAWEYRSSGKLGALSAPPVGADLRDEFSNEVTRNEALLQQTGVNGFVVFSSNRFGNHDILRMSLPDGYISRLTRNPHTETYPRISPDGRKLLFVRSQQPWVSQRNTVAWDLYLMDIASGKEWLIDNAASYPYWIDNDTAGYLYKGVAVMKQNLRTREKEEIYRSSVGNSMPRGAPITSPETSPLTGELVFTGKQSHIGMQTGFWGTAIWRNGGSGEGPIQGILDGCEINWSTDGSGFHG